MLFSTHCGVIVAGTEDDFGVETAAGPTSVFVFGEETPAAINDRCFTAGNNPGLMTGKTSSANEEEPFISAADEEASTDVVATIVSGEVDDSTWIMTG